MIVFLDIGAHRGQTLWEVLQPYYAFDRIYAFEPMYKHYHILDHNHGDVEHLEILNFGLADCTKSMSLWGTNRRGAASIYAEKANVDAQYETICDFVEASLFFRTHLSLDDINIVKINCEGSEIPILDNLIDTGEIWKITSASICWDSEKIPGMEGEEARVKRRLVDIGFDRHELPSGISYLKGKSHQRRILYWLRKTGLPVFK